MCNRFLNNFFTKAAIWLLLFFIISCDIVDKKSTINQPEYEIVTQKEYYPVYLRNKAQGTPEPKYYFDQETQEEYIFATEPNYDHFLDIYKIEGNKPHLIDSVKIPDSCFHIAMNRLEEFYVVDKNQIFLIPYQQNISVNNKGFLLNLSTGKVKSYSMWNKHPDRYKSLFMYANYTQYSLKDSLLFAITRYYYDKENTESDYQYKYPIFNIQNINDENIKEFFTYPKYLKNKTGMDSHYQALTTKINNKLIVNLGLVNELYEIDLHTFEQKKISFNNPFMQKINHQSSYINQKHFETDRYKQMIYNPYLKKLFLIQHMAEPYESEDGYTVKSYRDSKIRVLIFDENLKLEANLPFENKYYSYMYLIQPTPTGFIDLHHLEKPGSYRFRKHVLTNKTQ